MPIFPYLALMLILVVSCCVYLAMFSIELSFDAFVKKSPGVQHTVSFHWNGTLLFEVLSGYILISVNIYLVFVRCDRGRSYPGIMIFQMHSIMSIVLLQIHEICP